MPNAIRVYADTSVYGGVEDDEFAEASRAFFAQVRRGRFALAVSAVVAEEIEGAPERVRGHFDAMLAHAEILDVTPEAQSLQRAYLDADILTPKWQEDALHVALASVNECEVIVSWNFRHIVHFQKIPKYNAVNALHGYPSVAIHAPPEVLADADEND